MTIITTENIYQKVMSRSEFYSLMYPDFVKFHSAEEQIISIKTSSVSGIQLKPYFIIFGVGRVQIVICMMPTTMVKLGLLPKKN